MCNTRQRRTVVQVARDRVQPVVLVVVVLIAWVNPMSVVSVRIPMSIPRNRSRSILQRERLVCFLLYFSQLLPLMPTLATRSQLY